MSEPLTPVTPDEVQRASAVVAAFLNYLFWLDEGLTLTTDQIRQLYQRWVRLGENPWVVCDDLGLPEDPEW